MALAQNIPFSDYDFWGYLSAGFLLLYVVDSVIGTNHLTKDSWTVVEGVIAFSAAYAVGHLTAGVSSQLLERWLVGKLLGWPKTVLFGQAKVWRLMQKAFLGYFDPLPPETQAAARAQGREVGIAEPGEALFQAAYAYAKTVPASNERLQNFLNGYGFCRNIALVSFVNALLLEGAYRWFGGQETNRWWALVALVVGIGMTMRYLKFLRLFNHEVFTTFAYRSRGS